jgi:hypothetical protein
LVSKLVYKSRNFIEDPEQTNRSWNNVEPGRNEQWGSLMIIYTVNFLGQTYSCATNVDPGRNVQSGSFITFTLLTSWLGNNSIYLDMS